MINCPVFVPNLMLWTKKACEICVAIESLHVFVTAFIIPQTHYTPRPQRYGPHKKSPSAVVMLWHNNSTCMPF